MGTDLYQLGNHKIRFKERPFSELTTEIKTALDNAFFSNAEFSRLAALRRANSKPRNVNGSSKQTFQEVADDFGNSYLIDELKNID